MSERLHLAAFDCARAQSLLPRFVDGDLGAEESVWLRVHFEACAGCRAALAGFAELDSELTGWGRELDWRNPPPVDARECLSARMNAAPAPNPAMRWIPIAAAVAAGVVIGMIVAPRKPAPPPAEAPFIEIPYLAPLDPHENATIVRIDIRVATLIAAGYRVAADPNEIVPAEVLVGEDGRAHAVRVPADVGLNGTGD